MKFEPRKIYVSGTNSYILTLPKDWVERLGLKKGDIVFLEIREKSICVHSQKKGKDFIDFIDDPKATFKHLFRLIIAYYIAGFSSIKMKIHNEDQRRAALFATDMLMGAEILEDIGNELQLEIFLNLERFEINSIIEKMCGVILSLLKDYKNLISSSFREKEILSSVFARENEVDRLYFLLLRLLTLSGREGIMSFFDTMNYRSAVKALERISDHLNRIFEVSINISLNEEIAEVVERFEGLVRKTIVSFFKSDRIIAEEVFEELEKVRSLLGKIKVEIEKSGSMDLNYQIIFESFERLIGYLSDIAEISIDRSILKNTC
ncbi:MAG: phosphate uptake regulator PhoU [Archaeoglobaceae archaeon]|nr:phosphate uptake regulator PhoU [Archaeoglobaceae archaeon]MDW7990308.1 phosphate uptake regulator PhoU [Archaeoglobaceae archaeon]